MRSLLQHDSLPDVHPEILEVGGELQQEIRPTEEEPPFEGTPMTLRRIFPALPLNHPLRPNPSYSPVPCVYTVTTLTTPKPLRARTAR
jgi:hypothetical protein